MLYLTLDLCGRDKHETSLPIPPGCLSAVTVSSFRFNASTDVKGLDNRTNRQQDDSSFVQSARQSVIWVTVGGRRRAGRSSALGPGTGGRPPRSLNIRGDFLMRGRQQLKDSKGRWLHDSRPLMIPCHEWKMWRTEQGLAGLLTNGPLQSQTLRAESGKDFFILYSPN